MDPGIFSMTQNAATNTIMVIKDYSYKNYIAYTYQINMNTYNKWEAYTPEFCIFSPHEIILEPGTNVQFLYLLLNGDAYVSAPGNNGKDAVHIFCRKGDILGEEEFFLEKKCFSLVETITECVCMRINADAYRNNILNDPAILFLLGYSLAYKMATTSQKNADNHIMPLETRLASRILAVERNGIYKKNLSFEAEYLGISYRHLLRCLKQFTDVGILERIEKGSYFISNRDRLMELSKQY